MHTQYAGVNTDRVDPVHVERVELLVRREGMGVESAECQRQEEGPPTQRLQCTLAQPRGHVVILARVVNRVPHPHDVPLVEASMGPVVSEVLAKHEAEVAKDGVLLGGELGEAEILIDEDVDIDFDRQA